jgi:hypothetical protein
MWADWIGACLLASDASSLPARSISTARVPPVPTSTPKIIVHHLQSDLVLSVPKATFEDSLHQNASHLV